MPAFLATRFSGTIAACTFPEGTGRYHPKGGSTCDHASVHCQGRTDDVGSLVRTNEDDGIRNFFGGANAFVRDLALEESRFVFLCYRKTVEHSRFNRSRANDVDPNTSAGEFYRR